jgi:MFS family permease
MTAVATEAPRHRVTASFAAYLAVAGLLSLALWILLLLPNFLAARGWSSQKIGWVIGTYFSVTLFAQMLAGHLSDHHGSLRTALWGTAVGGAGGVAYLVGLWFPWVIVPARGLHALGTSLISAGVLLELVNSVPSDLRGRMIGYYGLPGFVMLGGGPILSEWFVYRWGFKGTFIAIIVIFASVAVILSRLPQAAKVMPVRTARKPFLEACRESFPLLRPVLCYSTLVGLCFSVWQSFLAPSVRSVGPGAVSNFGFGYAVGAVSTRLGLSHHLDTGGKRLTGIATMVGFGAALALIPQAGRPWHLLAIGAACGLSHGIYYPSLSSIAADRFHPSHTGQSMSLYFSVSSLGMFLGPPAWGALADRVGYGPVFAAAGALLAAGTLAFVGWELRASRRSALMHEPT